MIRYYLSRIGVFLSALFLSACSTFGFIFERLDWFAIWRLDSMFDLSEQQEDQVRPDLLALQSWMRQDGFPEIITRLENVIELWQQEQPESAYLYLISSMEDINRLFLTQMKEGVIRFSLQLSEKNAAHYRDYTREKQDDWFDDTHDIEARIDETIERLEKWFGHLNDQQIVLIEQHASLVENERQIRLDNLASWRDSYLNAALNRDAELIARWIDDLSIFWTADYIALRAHNNQKRQALIFELFPTLTDKQKRHAREHVEDWIEKLQDVLEE